MAVSTEPSTGARLHRISRVANELPQAKGLPTLQHEYDFMGYEDSSFFIKGWAVHLEVQWTTVEMYLNGEKVATCDARSRPDVATALPQFKFGERSGFALQVDRPGIGLELTDRADLIFYAGEKPIAAVFTPVRSDLETFVPLPPTNLMKRVIGSDNPAQFKRFALNCFGQYVAAAARHRDFKEIRRMLDWGCGCGRVTAHYLRIEDGPEVSGCDIDGEDIEWCRQNLTEGSFETTSPYVPLKYPDSSFDLVVSLSVFTHLTKDQQRDWLKEMDRILAPGGLFIVSVHGLPAAERAAERFLSERLKRQDFFDDLPDPALDGIAPDGYYRATYQKESFTRPFFGKFFDVLEYIEAGVGIQDLVVVRKKEKSGGMLGWLKGR